MAEVRGFNPTGTCSMEEVGDFKFGLSITGAEVAEVVKMLCVGRALGMDGIWPESSRCCESVLVDTP